MILTDDQKQVLKEYINSVDSTPDLRNFYNNKILDLRTIKILNLSLIV